MLAFKLGGKANLPVLPEVAEPVLHPPPSVASTAEIQRGEKVFQRYCAACHGDVAVSGGILPDLRYSNTLDSDQWFGVVLGGMLQTSGMVSFKLELSRPDVSAVRAYVIFRANQSLADKKRGPDSQ
jgi:alcohol dehydrogenase (cytochrome c)/quinohemoprotein ethanol dehydrogenase